MLMFTRLVNLFVYEVKLKSGVRRFKNGAYLFIDELDLLAESSAKEQRETNELIRHIYDNCPVCFCMVLAFTATSAELNVLFTEYVLSRVTKQIIMNFLEPDEAKVFVKEILDTARAESKKRKGYFPFEEAAVQAIVSRIVSITPRKIVNGMQQILEDVRLIGVDPSKAPISAQTLEDNSIVDDVLGA